MNNSNNELKNMRKGGSVPPLYHMAGGGPLFIPFQIKEGLDLNPLKRPELTKEEKSGTAPSIDMPDLKDVKMLPGDLEQGNQLLKKAYQTYAEARIKYGNDALAASDPYVKAAFAAATPNVYEMAQKAERYRNAVEHDKKIQDPTRPSSNELDLEDMRAMKAKLNGQMVPLYVNQTKQAYDNTPREALSQGYLGSTWENNNKIVPSKAGLQKDFDEIFGKANAIIKGETDPVLKMEKLIDIGEGSDAEKAQKKALVRQSTTSGDNRLALQAVKDSMNTLLSPQDELTLESIYVGQTYDATTGTVQDIYDEEGKVSDEYIKFRDNELNKFYNKYFQSTFGVNTTGFSDQTSGVGGNEPTDQNSTWINVIFDKGVGVKVNPMTLAIGPTIKTKDGVDSAFSSEVAVRTYTATPEITNDLNKQLVGQVASEVFGNDIVMDPNGGMNKLPSGAEVGVIFKTGNQLIKIPKPVNINGEWVMPKINYNANGEPVDASGKVDKSIKMQTMAEVWIAYTEQDMEDDKVGPQINAMMQTAIDSRGKKFYKRIPLSPKHAKAVGGDDTPSERNSEITKQAVELGLGIDLTNKDFFEAIDPSRPYVEEDNKKRPATFADRYSGLTDWATDEDMILVRKWVPINDAQYLEEANKLIKNPTTNTQGISQSLIDKAKISYTTNGK